MFILLILVHWVLVFLGKYLLVSDTLYFNSFGESFSYEQIKDLIRKGEEWEWLTYVILPFLLAVKILLVTICLSLGYFFTVNHFNFTKLLRVAIAAEFVFTIPILFKIVWFSLIQHQYNLNDLQLFYPLSALSIFNAEDVQTWLVYPLQVVNLFEILYMLVLAKNLSGLFKSDFTKSFELVVVSYGSGLTFWIMLVMFLAINYGK